MLVMSPRDAERTCLIGPHFGTRPDCCMKTGSNLNFWDDSRLRFDSTSPNGTNSTTRGFFNGPLLAVLETCGGMLKNATRELEQRRRAPRQLFHASLVGAGALGTLDGLNGLRHLTLCYLYRCSMEHCYNNVAVGRSHRKPPWL